MIVALDGLLNKIREENLNVYRASGQRLRVDVGQEVSDRPRAVPQKRSIKAESVAQKVVAVQLSAGGAGAIGHGGVSNGTGNPQTGWPLARCAYVLGHKGHLT